MIQRVATFLTQVRPIYHEEKRDEYLQYKRRKKINIHNEKMDGRETEQKMKSFSLIRHNADSDIVDNCGNFEEEVYQIMKRG